MLEESDPCRRVDRPHWFSRPAPYRSAKHPCTSYMLDGTKGIEPLHASVASSCITTLLRTVEHADCTGTRNRTLTWKVGASRDATSLPRCGWRIVQDSN